MDEYDAGGTQGHRSNPLLHNAYANCATCLVAAARYNRSAFGKTGHSSRSCSDMSSYVIAFEQRRQPFHRQL
ncbi:hypothetical protein D3C71_2045370 [compost metagenome]